jgi:hypothetical protein
VTSQAEVMFMRLIGVVTLKSPLVSALSAQLLPNG